MTCIHQQCGDFASAFVDGVVKSRVATHSLDIKTGAQIEQIFTFVEVTASCCNMQLCLTILILKIDIIRITVGISHVISLLKNLH